VATVTVPVARLIPIESIFAQHDVVSLRREHTIYKVVQTTDDPLVFKSFYFKPRPAFDEINRQNIDGEHKRYMKEHYNDIISPIEYKLGVEVEKIDRSLGIFCFLSLVRAHGFFNSVKDNECTRGMTLVILKGVGLGLMNKPSYIGKFKFVTIGFYKKVYKSEWEGMPFGSVVLLDEVRRYQCLPKLK